MGTCYWREGKIVGLAFFQCCRNIDDKAIIIICRNQSFSLSLSKKKKDLGLHDFIVTNLLACCSQFHAKLKFHIGRLQKAPII